MPKYITQPYDMDCGPVAVLNACKWAGTGATKRDDYWRLCVSMECDPDDGSKTKHIDRVLRNELKGYAKIKRLWHPALWEIEEHLKQGGAIVFSYIWAGNNDQGGHIALFTGIDEPWFLGHNITEYPNEWVHRNEMINYVYRIDKRWGYPGIWLLKKESNHV